MWFSRLPLPPGLNAQLLLVAGRLAIAIDRYPEAVQHVKAALRAATHSSNIAARERWATLCLCVESWVARVPFSKHATTKNQSAFPRLLCFICSPAILVSSSRVFEYLLDDRSAEVILLGCVLQYPDYKPALSSYGKLAARTVRVGTFHCLVGPTPTSRTILQ